jgi:hypothetical protein
MYFVPRERVYRAVAHQRKHTNTQTTGEIYEAAAEMGSGTAMYQVS